MNTALVFATGGIVLAAAALTAIMFVGPRVIAKIERAEQVTEEPGDPVRHGSDRPH